MRKEFCDRIEVQKLEQEFWDLWMEGADHVGYVSRFDNLGKTGSSFVYVDDSANGEVHTRFASSNASVNEVDYFCHYGGGYVKVKYIR